jgi:hypothetical protein
MARAIIRYSFDREEGKASRREMRKRLSASDAGFQPRGTASWETSGEPEPSVEQVLDAIRCPDLDAVPNEGLTPSHPRPSVVGKPAARCSPKAMLDLCLISAVARRCHQPQNM